MTTRRTFLGLLACLLPAPWLPAVPADKPRRPDRSWDLSFTGPEPVRLYDPFTGETYWLCQPGSEAVLTFRGRVFARVPLAAGVRTHYGVDAAAAVTKLLAAQGNRELAEHVYETDKLAWFFLSLAAANASRDRAMRGWPLEDVVACRQDPIGRLMFRARDERQEAV